MVLASADDYHQWLNLVEEILSSVPVLSAEDIDTSRVEAGDGRLGRPEEKSQIPPQSVCGNWHDEPFYELPQLMMERLLKLEPVMAAEVRELERLLE